MLLGGRAHDQAGEGKRLKKGGKKELRRNGRKARRMESRSWGAIHQLLSIIFKLRILVFLHVSTLPYVVRVKNSS
jgi:hypothetical protein